jgi:hypothetical protein
MSCKIAGVACVVTLAFAVAILPVLKGAPAITLQIEQSSAADQNETQRRGRIFVDVIMKQVDGYKWQIIAVDPENGQWEKMTGKGRDVRVSDDGRTLAFERNGAIWTCSTDGSDNAQPVSKANHHPVWSPDGTQLLSCQQERTDDDSDWKFTTWDTPLDNTGQQHKTAIPKTDIVWDWSPDGQWLVTSSRRDVPNGMGWQLYLMRPDGSESHYLTRGGVNFYPTFSPDGTQIVYTDNSSFKHRVKVVGIDGKNRREIFRAKGLMRLTGVGWSPDGKQLACTVSDWQLREDGRKVFGIRGADPNYRLLVVDSDGENPRELRIELQEGVKLIHLGDHPHWR